MKQTLTGYPVPRGGSRMEEEKMEDEISHTAEPHWRVVKKTLKEAFAIRPTELKSII